MRLRAASFFIAVILATAGSAKAQFVQYTPPGGPEERPEDRKQRLERELEEARFRLGAVRVSPVAGLRDAAYVRNLFDSGGERSDFTVTVAAGVRAYLRTGPKVTWIGTVVPEYVWWREREDARRLNQRYGLRTIGFFNRLTLEASAARDERQGIVSPEVPELVSSRADRIGVDAELKLTGATFLFASAGQGRQDNIVDELDDPRTRSLELLDREEQVLRAGLRWRPVSGLTFGVGAARSDVDFERSLRDSSNSGTGPVLEVVLDRRRVFFQADLVARSLEAETGSRFVDFDGVTGGASASFELGQRVGVTAYGSRAIVYSLSETQPYMDDRRIGISTRIGLAERLSFRVFAETGTHRYVAFLPAAPRRSDDLSAIGGGLRFELPGALQIELSAVRTDFDSNLPGNDRTYTVGGVTATLGSSWLRGNL